MLTLLLACTGAPSTVDSGSSATDSDPVSNEDSGLVDSDEPTDSGDTGDTGDTGPDEPVDADGDGFTDDVDCDDTDPGVNPSGVESCDGKDNDCDGQVDDSTDWATIPGTYPNLSTGIQNWETDDVFCLQPGTHTAITTLSGKEFTVMGADRDTTFISGDGERHALYDGGSTIHVESVTFVEGYPNALAAGPAIYTQGDLTLRDVVVDGVAGIHHGTYGVVYAEGGSLDVDGLVVRNVVLDHDDRDLYGLLTTYDIDGTLKNVTIEDNDIVGAQVFGGVLMFQSTLALEDIDLVGNRYQGDAVSGVGLMTQWDAQVTATRVRVLDNDATASGSAGGALISSYGSTLTVENAVVAGQDADLAPFVLAGDDAQLDITNATLAHNSSVRGGVGYFQSSGSSQALFTNVIAAWNTADEGYLWYGESDAAYIRSTHYLLHENESVDEADKAGSFDSGPWYGGGGVFADPLFVDTSGDVRDWDLRLAEGSPGIDAGDASISDADGSTSDIGAYGGPNAWE